MTWMAESLYQHAKARIITDPLEAHVEKSFGAGCCNCSQSVITPQSGFNGYNSLEIRNDS